MSKIKTVEDLRNFSLELIDKLREGEIGIKEAWTTAKICDVVLKSVQLELDYARANGHIANVPFVKMAQTRVVPAQRLDNRDTRAD